MRPRRVQLPAQNRFGLLLPRPDRHLLNKVLSLRALAELRSRRLAPAALARLQAAHALAYTLQRYVARPEETAYLPRRIGLDLLETYLQRRDPAAPAVLGLTDLKNLRHFNERFGLHVGDVMVLRSNRALAGAFPANRTWVIRTGGDEQLLFIEGIDVETARLELARISKILERQLESYLRGRLRSNRDQAELPPAGLRTVLVPLVGALEPARAQAERLLAAVRDREKAGGGIGQPPTHGHARPGSRRAARIIRDAMDAIMRDVSADATLPLTVWQTGGPESWRVIDPLAVLDWIWDFLPRERGDEVPGDLVERVLGPEVATVLRNANSYESTHAALVDLYLTTSYLLYEAAVDDLTGGWKRRLGMVRILQTLRALRSEARPAVLVMLELCDLTTVNNRHLHNAGDLYIQCWARAARSVFGDLFVRVSGPRAAILVPDAGEPEVTAQLATVRERFRALVETEFSASLGSGPDAEWREILPGARIAAGVTAVDVNDQWLDRLGECLTRLYQDNFFPPEFEQPGDGRGHSPRHLG